MKTVVKSSRLLKSQATYDPIKENIESILPTKTQACLIEVQVFVTSSVRHKSDVAGSWQLGEGLLVVLDSDLFIHRKRMSNTVNQ